MPVQHVPRLYYVFVGPAPPSMSLATVTIIHVPPKMEH